MVHDRHYCVSVIEAYASRPLTVDRMRAACGLDKKIRSGEAEKERLYVPIDVPSQEDGQAEEEQSLKTVAAAIRDECLNKNKTVLTKGMFSYMKLPPEHPKHMDRDTIWAELVKKTYIIPGQAIGKFKDGALSAFMSDGKLASVIDIKPVDIDVTYPEVHEIGNLRIYAGQCADREANALILIAYYDAMLKGEVKRGRQA